MHGALFNGWRLGDGVILERRSRSTWWSRRIAVFAAVLFAMAALCHRHELIDTVTLFWIVGGVGTLAVLGLGLAAAGLSQIWREGDLGARDGVIGVLVALLVLAPFFVSGYRFFAYPALNDVSTDLADPPRFTFLQAARTPQMNPLGPIGEAAAALQQERYPEITGRRYDLAADRILGIVRQLTADRGWTVVYAPNIAREEPVAGDATFEAVAYSLLLAIPSDVAIRIVDEQGSTYVDMRSASRYGLHDFGDNARRIDAFLSDLDTEAALQAGVTVEEPADQ